MSLFHFHVKPLSRAKGANALRSAAYRSGSEFTDPKTGDVYNYTRKKDVSFSKILLPDGAPSEFADRFTLWSAVEKKERRKDSQLARDFEIAFPRELSPEHCARMIQAWCHKNLVSKGMIVDINCHKLGSDNPHVHVMATMRHVEKNGFGDKNREWDQQYLCEIWRKDWAETCNRELEKIGSHSKVDHRSYARQGSSKLATKHVGPQGYKRQAVGERDEIIEFNEAVALINKIQEEIRLDEKHQPTSQSWADSSFKDSPEMSDVPSWSDVEVLVRPSRVEQRKAPSVLPSVKSSVRAKSDAEKLFGLREEARREYTSAIAKVRFLNSELNLLGSGMYSVMENGKHLDELQGRLHEAQAQNDRVAAYKAFPWWKKVVAVFTDKVPSLPNPSEAKLQRDLGRAEGAMKEKMTLARQTLKNRIDELFKAYPQIDPKRAERERLERSKSLFERQYALALIESRKVSLLSERPKNPPLDRVSQVSALAPKVPNHAPVPKRTPKSRQEPPEPEDTPSGDFNI